MSVRRDTRAKESIPLDRLAERLPALLDDIQSALFEAARRFRDENTTFAPDLAAVEACFRERRGYVAVPWDGDAAFEADVKARTMATLRCIPLDQSRFRDEAKGRPWALFARAY
jgi:prolyl-tRNA synthetase